jgi:predicted esterase
MARRFFLIALLLLPLPASATEKKPPFPAGKSVHIIKTLRCRIEMPVDFDASKKYSLLVGLHGMNATAIEFRTWFEPLVQKDVIVCCPKSTKASWSSDDIRNVRRVVAHLKTVLPIGEGRIHGIGFSNGGANLGPVVFDEKLGFSTACWMGSGFPGGKVPKEYRKTFAAIVLVGEKDPALSAAKRAVKALAKKVKRVDFESQPDLAHEIPDELMPFYYYWVTVMEGRFFPGEDESLDWYRAPESALETMKEDKRGGFLYFFDEKDVKNADAKYVQNVTLMDPAVRVHAKRLIAAILDVEIEEEGALFKKYGLKKTPAIVVLKPDGTTLARFEGRIEPKALAGALAKVVPSQRPGR